MRKSMATPFQKKAYRAWEGMRNRCRNPNYYLYDRYGGRGIQVEGPWDSFDVFYRDMGDPPSLKHSIDRIDNDKGYSKSNCRWATAEQQANNKSPLKSSFEFQGKKRSIREIAQIIGISVKTLSNRVYSCGWTIEEATSIPPLPRNQRKTWRNTHVS